MSNHPWWQRAVIYEIVVPSFQDSNNDGHGDLAGITSRLDYLQWLGVDALWLTPIFTSPMYDLGYDSAAFDTINPLFGQLEDLQTLLREAHTRQLRIILDFVPNHTSVAHPWFKASRSSRQNEYRDWFLWSDGQPNGKPPNNWVNRFGRSVWTWDSVTEQYYLGSFSDQQPDLNWRHPSVRAAIHDAMRYWFDLGVDGLRIDALAHLIKDVQLRDNPPNPSYSDQEEPSNRLAQHYSQNQPELLDVIEGLRAVFDEYPDRLFLGEVYQSPEQIAAYQRAGAHLLLNTAVLQTAFESATTRNVVDLIEARTGWQLWPSHCSGNHDIGRVANRLSGEQLRQAALLLFTLRGTPTMYYGEELGMVKYDIPPDRLRDPSGLDQPRYGRDGHRTPMPWTPDSLAGFSEHAPWLPFSPDHATLAVAVQQPDQSSLLRFYQRLLQLRRQSVVLQTGSYRPLDFPPPLYVFERSVSADDHHERYVIALNMSSDSSSLDLTQFYGPTFAVSKLLSTTPDDAPDQQAMQGASAIRLAAHEGVICRLDVISEDGSAGR